MVKIKPFADFKLHKTVDNAIIEKYSGVVPPEMIDFWKEYGFGTFAKGFLKSINPDEYQELLEKSYISKSNKYTPILATALGDILVVKEFTYLEEGEYFDIYIIRYRYGRDQMVCGAEELFDAIFNINYYTNSFLWGDYIEAVLEHDVIPEYDECYGYVPLLGLGGSKSIETMELVGIKEQIMLIREMIGIIHSVS